MKVLSFLPRCALQSHVAKALYAPPFIVETAVSAEECLQLAQLKRHEAVLVDADTRKFADVLALVKLLRQEQSDASLFVFARSLDLEQRLRLFEVGMDDFVHEPFFAAELARRLRLSIRLHQAASVLASSDTVNVLHAGDLEIDLVRRRVTRQGKPIELRSKEFLLLVYLVRNVNRPVTRTMILEHVWSPLFGGMTNVVDVHIHALRSKVDRDFSQKMIQTKRGIGYIFTCTNGLPPIPHVRGDFQGHAAVLADPAFLR